ncbi:hypothetical protein V474_22895 [Novosphingobium barchaimii LL02]|uniref:Uncharacterized protein n=1 Tax=Novosphingobium barchaimii LL02 TaxID=1114963 RepID=A0A0J7XRF1_9SPHN|nr:hypothetical protein [Novosphingobium barchaimii]KMS53623.1 hypothetical protein V474_22895 [Novosphingobium barchaimii LL02]
MNIPDLRSIASDIEVILARLDDLKCHIAAVHIQAGLDAVRDMVDEGNVVQKDSRPNEV